jgi:hypothetical protein
MKITKNYLKQIIKEEKTLLLYEQQLQETLNNSLIKRFAKFLTGPVIATSAFMSSPAQAAPKKPSATVQKGNDEQKKLDIVTDTFRSSGRIGQDDVVVSIVDISTANRQGVGYNVKNIKTGEEYGFAVFQPK